MLAARISLVLLLPGLAFAQEPASAPASAPSIRGALPKNEELPRISFREALEKSAVDPRVSAARSEGEIFEAKAFQGKWQRLQGSYEGLLAPITELRGNALVSDTGEFPLQLGRPLGLFTRHQLTVVVPLLTFGKFDVASELSLVAEDTGDELVRRARAEVAVDVRRAYFGALLADDILDLLTEAQAQISRAREEIQRGLQDGSGDFTTIDLYKVDVAQGELLARAAEARAGLALAREALGLLSRSKGPMHPAEDFLAPLEGTLPSLEELKAAAIEARPELRLLSFALRAKEGEAKLARASLFPDLGLLVSGAFSFANVVDNQTSPFAFDPFNQRYLAAGVGARYSLDVGAKLGKLKEARAARDQLASMRDAALGGFAIEIAKAYGEALSARERFLAREAADKTAQKWVKAVAADFVVGNAETRDLIEALIAAGDVHSKYLQAVFEYNLAIGALEKAVGREVLSPASP